MDNQSIAGRLFYVAASYVQREKAKWLAGQIRKRGGFVGARWLTEEQKDRSPGMMQRYGLQNLADLRESDALVMLGDGMSTSGGMWVELGYSMGIRKPIFYIGRPIEGDVFVVQREITKFETEEEFLNGKLRIARH